MSFSQKLSICPAKVSVGHLLLSLVGQRVLPPLLTRHNYYHFPIIRFYPALKSLTDISLPCMHVSISLFLIPERCTAGLQVSAMNFQVTVAKSGNLCKRRDLLSFLLESLPFLTFHGHSVHQTPCRIKDTFSNFR